MVELAYGPRAPRKWFKDTAGCVGQIHADIRVVNCGDEAVIARGLAEPGSARALDLPGVLVDTGATTLCLPAGMVAALGLPLRRRAHATTARGDFWVNVYGDAQVYLLGRNVTVECVELEDGTNPLLGVEPLEFMGIEPDLRNQALVALPDEAWMRV
jgi:predicted aspartyl protease